MDLKKILDLKLKDYPLSENDPQAINAYIESRNEMIIIISDLHLGAIGTYDKKLLSFLKDIREKRLGNVKHLILAGDFLENMVSYPEEISNKYGKIIETLNDLHKQIDIYYLLGNHEIPVDGDFENEFEERRKIFFNEYKGIELNFFIEEELCQYALIYVNSINPKSFSIKKFNTLDRLKEFLNSNNNQEEIRYTLVLHGYQFGESKKVTQIWRWLLKKKNKLFKKIADFIYNGILKNGYIDDILDNFKDQDNKGKKIKELQLRVVEFSTKLDNILKNESDSLRIQKVLEDPDEEKIVKLLSSLDFNLDDLKFEELLTEEDLRNKATLTEIERDFDNLKLNLLTIWIADKIREGERFHKKRLKKVNQYLENQQLFKINTIVYGHTHIKEEGNLKAYNKETEVFNDGTWQHRSPSYFKLEIKDRSSLLDA